MNSDTELPRVGDRVSFKSNGAVGTVVGYHVLVVWDGDERRSEVDCLPDQLEAQGV